MPDVKLFVPVPVLKRMKVVHDISPVDASNFSQSSRLQALPSVTVDVIRKPRSASSPAELSRPREPHERAGRDPGWAGEEGVAGP